MTDGTLSTNWRMQLLELWDSPQALKGRRVAFHVVRASCIMSLISINPAHAGDSHYRYQMARLSVKVDGRAGSGGVSK